MKLISWNVNGLRACIQKGFMDFFNEQDADIFALQETKLQPHQIELELPGYHQYWHSAERKGYSGTAVFTKQKPLSVRYDFDEAEGEHPKEGRVITLEFEQFYFVTAYVPNSKEELARLDYRMQWEDAMARHLTKLNETKPVVYTGDLNVAVEEIDLKNPKTNHFNPGFSDQTNAPIYAIIKTRASPIKSARRCVICWAWGLRIRSEPCIRKRLNTPGGPIVSIPARKTSGGGLTISSFPSG